MHEQYKKLILLSCAILLSLLLSECLLRLYFRFVINYDIEMWRYASHVKVPVLDDRRHVHAPNKKESLMGVDVAINEKGLRDFNYPYEKPPGTFRIVAIGDSFTFGWGVLFNEIYVKRLEKKLNHDIPHHQDATRHYEVINLGVGNYNTEQEIAMLELEGLKYHPDLVLLGFYINDAEPAQHLTHSFFTQHSYLLAFLKQRLVHLKPYFEPNYHYAQIYHQLYGGPRWNLYEKQLDHLLSIIRSTHLDFLVVLLPDLRRIDADEFGDIYKKVQMYFINQDCPVINLRSSLDQTQKSSVYWVASDDPHPNARAHGIFAEEIYKELQNTFKKESKHIP